MPAIPTYNQCHGKSSSNILKLGKIHRGREVGDPSSGCKQQNSWSITLEKYTEAEKLEIQVLDARNRIFGLEHPHTILAMEYLAATLRCLGKYIEAENLVIPALKVKSRVPAAEFLYIIATVANVQGAQETQLLHAQSTGPEEEI
jgi:hypothetical protein